MSNPHLLTGLGAAASIFLAAAGSAASTVPSGVFAQHAVGGVLLVWAPIMISGVLAIYGCIISVILSHSITNEAMTEAQGYRNLAAGMAVGLSCLASGLGMARFMREFMEQEHARAVICERATPAVSNSTNNCDNDDSLREGLISSNMSNKPLQPTWRLLVVLTFTEAIGLYGLIVALFLSSN